MSNEGKNPTDDVSKSAGNAGKKAGKAVAKMGKNTVKKAGKKIAQKIAKASVKLALNVIGKLLLLIAPYALPILIVIALAIAGYYIIYEIRGTEQIYVFDKDAENKTIKDAETNYYKTSSSDTSGKTQAIQTYYRYMSQHSYWQIITDDNTKLEQDVDVRDYYNKENEYYLNSNLLFSLDETMHKKKFIYPEQFIKPIHYDPDKLEQKPLTDEKGNVIVESEEYNEDGDKTGEKVKSVADYGIGSVFKYKKDEKTVTVEGTMYKKDVWDTECNCKKSVDTDEPFEFTMEGYPQEIWLMTKAITFVGDFEFKYENEKTKQGELSDNQEPGADNEAVKKVQVGRGKQMKTEYYTEIEVDEEGNETTVEKSREVFDRWVPLYGYRKGGVFQTIPVQKDTITNDKGQKYLRDFLYNYKIYTPKSVLGEFNLESRGVTSGGFEMGEIDMEAGSGVESGQYKTALQYFSIIQNYASMYGVDPYLILAKMTQESGGIADRKDGLMQITGNGARTISALNVQTKKKDTYTVYNEDDRRNPEKSIRWGIMYFASLMGKMDGDPLKALQSYNFGEGGMNYIKKNHPEDWKTKEWMKWREESRIHYGGTSSRSASYHCIPHLEKTGGSLYGDSCYVENVLKYYGGGGAGAGEGTGTGTENDEGGIIGGIKDVFEGMKEAFEALVKDYSEETKFYSYHRLVSPRDVDWALRFATAMEKYILFSETDKDEEDLSFWESGYIDSVTGGGDYSDFVATEEVDGYQSPLNLPNASSLISSLPGWRVDPNYGGRRHHGGTDIAIPKNTPVYATADGKVYHTHSGETYNNGAGFGNVVKVQHANGVTSIYAHLTSLSVKNGAEVKKGQLVGLSGSTGKSTGYHLHFEMSQNGVLLDTSLIIKGVPGKLQPAPR